MKRLILILIIALAFVLRFWSLNNFPALNADEASNAYDAYSLITTGLDQHGNPWPIHFQSFNDYKPGFYVYLVLPFVKFLGLNEWSARIPGALAGVLSVLAVYLLVKELLKNERPALIASFFLAISPWHIQFSRGGWEVNVATFLLTLGVWLFIRSANREFAIKPLLFSILAFAVSLYTYHAERVIVPILGIGLLIIYWQNAKRSVKPLLIAAVAGFILLLPLAKDISSGAVASRAAGVGLFADPGPRSRIEEQRGEHQALDSLLARTIHNKAVNYGLAFLGNWAIHYWGEFLFLSGDVIERNKVPETGQMYMYDIVLVGVGLLVVVKSFKKEHGVIILWLAIAPLAAALTFQAPHALRAHNMVIPLVMICAIGLDAVLAWISKYERFKKFGYLIVSIIIALGFARYEHMYWTHMAKEYPYSSQYGAKELVSYIQENQDKYKKILVTNRYDQPYILFLFYMKYDPAKFQSEHGLTPRDGFGFSTVNHFDKYSFATIKFDQAIPENHGALIVGTKDEITKEANIVKDIYGTNGFLYFRAVAN